MDNLSKKPEGKEKKKRYKIEYDRPNCIEILSCAASYPERWTIGEDNKANLIGGREDENNPGSWILKFTEEELEKFKISAEACPVNVIHIIDLETGERLI